MKALSAKPLAILFGLTIAIGVFGQDDSDPAMASPVWSAPSSPLSLENTILGYNAEESQAVLGLEFAGVWQVTHVEGDVGGEAPEWTGTADVLADGSDIRLVLQGPDGQEIRYEFLEAQADSYIGDGPIRAALEARFRRIDEAVEPESASDNDAEMFLTGEVTTITMPRRYDAIDFALDGTQIEVPVKWVDDPMKELRVKISTRDDDDELSGIWMEERESSYKGGGIATWVRGKANIVDVLVVENQVDLAAGTGYPYRRDGSRIEQLKAERTLVVYGKNLPKFADGARIESNSEFVQYRPVFTDGADREAAIERAFSAAKKTREENTEAFLVTALLNEGVLPGFQGMTVNGSRKSWPLVFANEQARFRFVRGSDEPVQSFYLGDQGALEVAFVADIPFESVDIKLTRGVDKPKLVGILTATPIPEKDDEPGFRTYRSNPLHFVSAEDPSLAPPKDDAALPVKATHGVVLHAALVDPAQAITRPDEISADIRAYPSDRGGLWHETLDELAAQCSEVVAEKETLTDADYTAYAASEATNVSHLIITEVAAARNQSAAGTLASGLYPQIGQVGRTFYVAATDSYNDISLSKGDHAAAILIGREFMNQAAAALPGYQDIGINPASAARFIEHARNNPQLRNGTFWQDSMAEQIEEGLIWDSTIEISLDRALDSGEEAWLLEQVMLNARNRGDLLVAAIERTGNALNDCNIEELLLLSGHRTDPLVAAILPRLMKLQVDVDRRYWVPDRVARAYVASLFTAGAAVRALDEYADQDKIYAGSLVLSGAGGLAGGAARTAAAAYAVAGAEAIALGSLDYLDYAESERAFDYAHGASLVAGDDILADAAEERKSAVFAAATVLLPVGAAALPDIVRGLRNFDNVGAGRQLLDETPEILGDLASAPLPDQKAVLGYYDDLLARSQTSSIDSLSDVDRNALENFNEALRSRGVEPPALPTTRLANDPSDIPSWRDGETLDDPRFLEDTASMEPPVGDPRVDTSDVSLEDVLNNQPVDDSPPLPRVANPVSDFADTPPGSLSNHLTPEQVRRLFDPDRVVLSPEEVLMKADLIRNGRVPLTMAQGDPDVLDALDRTFGISRDRPAVTDGGTIIEDSRGAAFRDEDTLVDPESTDFLPETVLERPSNGDLSDTAVFGADDETVIGSSGPSVSTAGGAPPIERGNLSARELTGIENRQLAETWAALRHAEYAGLARNIPGSADRGFRLDFAKSLMQQATPEVLENTSTISMAMQQLDVNPFDAINHSSLFAPSVGTGTDAFGFGPDMQRAIIAAKGVYLYGRAPVSAATFARINNISETAAEVAIQEVTSQFMFQAQRTMLIPITAR